MIIRNPTVGTLLVKSEEKAKSSSACVQSASRFPPPMHASPPRTVGCVIIGSIDPLPHY